MKRYCFILLVIVAALGLVPVYAAPSAALDVTDLARYFAGETPGYVVLRTDDGFIDEMDNVLQQIIRYLPPEAVPPQFSLKMIYNAPMGSGVTFGKDIRPWLGDMMAIGMPASVSAMMEMRDPPVLIVASITDRAGAEDFFSGMLIPTENYRRSTVGEFTVFEPTKEFVDGVAAINDEVAMIAMSIEHLPLQPLENSLAASPAFQGVVDLLPAESYNVFAYLDVPAISNAMFDMYERFGDTNPLMPYLREFYQVIGAEGIGLTILDGFNLVMDVVQLKGDTSRLEAMGVTVDYPGAPVSPAIAASIPADAPLVMQGAAFGPQMLTAFKNLRALGDFIQKEGILGKLAKMSYRGERAAEMLDRFNIKHILTFLEFGFAGMTGLNLEKDVLAWMDGDYAHYLRVLPLQGGGLPVTLDLVSLTATSDSAATLNMLNQLEVALQQYEIPYMRERDTLVFAGVIPNLLPPEARGFIGPAPELDIMMGTNGSLLAAGTRPGVTYSLDPRGPSLAENPDYMAAQAQFLPGSEVIFYMNLKPLFPVIERLADMTRAPEMRQLIPILSVLRSASITGVRGETGSAARFVLSVSDAPPPPRPPTEAPAVPTQAVVPTVAPTATPSS